MDSLREITIFNPVMNKPNLKSRKIYLPALSGDRDAGMVADRKTLP
jgi:hypothetical protein